MDSALARRPSLQQQSPHHSPAPNVHRLWLLHAFKWTTMQSTVCLHRHEAAQQQAGRSGPDSPMRTNAAEGGWGCCSLHCSPLHYAPHATVAYRSTHSACSTLPHKSSISAASRVAFPQSARQLSQLLSNSIASPSSLSHQSLPQSSHLRIAMGCGSSTSAPMDPVMAAPPKGLTPAGAAAKHVASFKGATPRGGGLVRAKTFTSNVRSFDSAPSSNGVAGAAAPASVTAASTPTLASPALSKRNSSAAGGLGIVLCDVDAAHAASFWCGECEEHYCRACDATVHARKKTKSHVRSPLPHQAGAAAAPSPAAPSAPPPLRAPAQLGPLRQVAGGPSCPFAPLSTSPPGTLSPMPASTPASPAKPKQQPLPQQQQPQQPQHTPLVRTRTVQVGALANGSPAGGLSARSSPPTSKRGSMVASEQKESGSSSPTVGPVTPGKRSSTGVPRGLMRSTTTMKPIGAKKPMAGVEHDQKYIHAVPIEKLRSLAGSQLEVVWQQYDLDGNGVLDRKELALLASDCIARTLAMVGEEVRKQNPNVSESELQAAIEREREFILPGGGGKKEEAHQKMVKMLIRKLDVNGDGSVTKAELMMQWNSFSASLFQVRDQGALDCCIM